MPGKGGVDNTVRRFVRDYFEGHPIDAPGKVQTVADAAEVLWNSTDRMPNDRLGVVFSNNGLKNIPTKHLYLAMSTGTLDAKCDAQALAKALFIDICLAYVAEDSELMAMETKRQQFIASMEAIKSS